MALEQTAEEYFSKLNPMASRMYTDMNEVKHAYEDLWKTLSDKEQKQILSESIITPDVSLKYKQNEIQTKFEDFAVKLIIDDHCQYRDEHSGPFSFKTRSQRDLSLFETEKDVRPKQVLLKPKHKKPVVCLDQDISNYSEKETGGNVLPKTGLDFLDNW